MTGTYFNLYVEHSISANLQGQCRPDIVSQTLFVALLNCSPFCSESLVFSIWKQSLEPGEVLQPDTLLQLEGLRNERAQFRITLRRHQQYGQMSQNDDLPDLATDVG